MKTTKKLLMILSAITLLAATVFTIVSSAVVAGEGPTMSEYLNMKKVESENFEDGTSFTGIANKGDVPGQYQSLVGGVRNATYSRRGVASVYDPEGTSSTKFFVIDYNYNFTLRQPEGDRPPHLYVQPKLGFLDNADKTPVNGFVSEFDLAFFSQLETEMEKKTETVVDPTTGEETTRFVTNPKYDEEGNVIRELAWVIDPATGEDAVDADGNKTPIYETDDLGNVVLDDNGQPKQAMRDAFEFVMIPVMVPLYHEDGTPVLNAKGEHVYGEKDKKLPFNGMSAAFEIDMYNTHTYMDGSVKLIRAYAVAASDNDPGRIEFKLADTSTVLYTAAPDEWTHITIQYDAKNLLTSIYFGRDTDEGGRKLVATVATIDTSVENKGGASAPVYPLAFRIGNSASYGCIGLDNFISYQGTTVHDPDFITSMPEAERSELTLVHFAEILADEGASANARHQAYLDIGEYVIDEFYNKATDSFNFDYSRRPDLYEACLTYIKFDNDEDGILSDLVASVNENNAKTFKTLVNNALGVSRQLAAIDTRKVRVDMASDYLTEVGKYIDRQSQDYITANATLKELEAALEADIAANEFIRVMTLFTNAVNYGASVSRITTHYNAALALRDSITDPQELAGPDKAGYVLLKDAVDHYDGTAEIPSAASYVEQANLAYNASRFINITNILKTTSESDWATDDGTIEKLWYLAFNILRDSGVDEGYEGYEEAKYVFDMVHKFFWKQMQEEHIAALSEKLSTYNSADSSYIDKAGICTYVDKYVDLNSKDLDLENSDLVRLIERNETYKAQLETLVGDYKNLLTQNTTKFTNTMKAAMQYDTYAEIKPLFDEATEYYYSMDIIGEETEYYVALYEVLRDSLVAIEGDSAMFVAIVNGTFDGADFDPLAEITDKTDLYISLNACYSYMTYLDTTYEGAAEAKAVFDAKYAEYIGSAELVNAQLHQTLDTACAARGMWDIDSIVAFVNSLFD